MGRIYLVARRDYLAYVGAWGFWASLILMPVFTAIIAFAPIVLARAEPPRAIAIIADRQSDADIVARAFSNQARNTTRGEIDAYLAATAPSARSSVIAAYDAAPDRDAAIAAAREALRKQSPGALGAFPGAAQRYVVRTPVESLEGLKPYLLGAKTVDTPAGPQALYGALAIKRDAANVPRVEFWSVNLSQDEPLAIARAAMRLALRREALAQQGLDPKEADRLDQLDLATAQFDPRSAPSSGAVTIRDRAPFWVALLLALLLWTSVFSAANMLLSSVVEERSNKILDTVLTSVTPLELLIGKLCAVAAVSLTLFLVWGGLGGGLVSIAIHRSEGGLLAQFAEAFLEPRLLVAFAIGFVCGYLMYGAIFLSLGSLCEAIQEAQTLFVPVSIVLMAPMLLAAPALLNPNAPIIVAASWFPLFTPFLLLVRAPAGLSWLEIIGMGGLMLVALVFILNAAARVFRIGVIEQGNLTALRKRMFAKKT